MDAEVNVKTIKVLVVDDHLLYRSGIIRQLSEIPIVERIDEAGNGLEAIEKCNSNCFDVVFMDISMPVMNGIEATKYLKSKFPDIRIVIMTMFDNDKQFIELIKLGVCGYLLKQSATSDELRKAFDVISTGEQYFTPEVFEVWSEYVQDNNLHLEENEVKNQLSERQIEIIILFCKQYTAPQIADKLFISEATVNNHRSHIMHKMGVDNIVGLVLYAIRYGIFIP